MKMASESPVKSQGEASIQVSVDAKRDSLKEELCRRLGKTKQQRPKPYERSPSASASTCTSSDESNSEGDHDGTTTTTTKTHHRRQKRIAANSRERKRMHTVNSAFDQLRELVPTYPSNRKLSKIDTLRLACTYINDLTALVRNPATTMQHGEDVKLYHEAYMQQGSAGNSPPTPSIGMMYPGGVQVKSECGAGTVDYTSSCGGYQQYRLQPSYIGGSVSTALCVHSHSPCLCQGAWLCHWCALFRNCIITIVICVQDCASSDYSETCASEAENSSPPYFSQGACAAGIAATRPPPLTRTNSDSAAMPRSSYTHVMPMYHTLPPNCSPLVTVQHSLQPSHGLMSPNAQSIPPPIWQRTASVPYCLYGQWSLGQNHRNQYFF